MGIFSWLKPGDRVATWIKEQIAEHARTGDTAALAHAAAALGGDGAMLFGMVMPAELAGRDELRDRALAALRAQIPKLADDKCDAVFAIIDRARLPIDIAARRAALDASRATELERKLAWLRAQIDEHAAAGKLAPLVDACATFNGYGGMAFGMAVRRDLPGREALRDRALDALRPHLATLSHEDCEHIGRAATRAHLPIDVTTRQAELVAIRQAARDAAVVAAGVEPRNAELEAAIADDPDDEASHVVLADWLQAQHHPRGELVMLQLRAETDPKLADTAAAHLDAHAPALLGPLVAHQVCHDGSDQPAFTWRRGFIRRARLSFDENADTSEDGLAEILDLLLAHPSGRYLAELVIGINREAPHGLDDVVAVLARRAPPHLRALHLGDFEREQTEMSWYEIGQLGALWPAVPALRRLIVQGGTFELGAIDLPLLEHAEFRTGGLSVASAHAIATAHWPALRSLDVWFGDPGYGGDTIIADVRPMLARTDLPALVHLGLMNATHTDETCAVLPGAPLAAQLRELDLSMGTMSDAGAHALASAATAFPWLEKLDVSRNFVTGDGLAALRRAFRTVISTAQETGEDRYPSVGE